MNKISKRNLLKVSAVQKLSGYGIFRRIVAFVLFMAVYGHTSATNYYFAANGDDFNNNGLSIRSPWKGTAKLNEIMAILNPDDSVLLRRGDVFDGGIRITRSGAPGSVIYFGAYGTGAKPVLNGSVNHAVIAKNAESIAVKNTEITNTGVFGIAFSDCGNTFFENNKVHNAGSQGLLFERCDKTIIRRNEIKNIGLIAGMGINGSDSHNALGITGSCNLIEYNKIDSIGYIALRFEGDLVTQ